MGCLPKIIAMASSASYDSSMKQSQCEEYIVQQGDTVESISIAHDVSFSLIKKFNRVVLQNNNHRVYPGLKLFIPIKTAASNESIPSSGNPSNKMKIPSEIITLRTSPDLTAIPLPSIQLASGEQAALTIPNERFISPSSSSSSSVPGSQPMITDVWGNNPPVQEVSSSTADGLISKSERLPPAPVLPISSPSRRRSASMQMKAEKDYEETTASPPIRMQQQRQSAAGEEDPWLARDDSLSLASLSASPIFAMSGLFSALYSLSSFSRPVSQPSGAEVADYKSLEESPYSYTPQIIGDAKILTADLVKQIQPELPESMRLNDWVILYSMLDNGTDLTTFYRLVGRHACTILFVQTLQGDVFGGYTQSRWQVALHYCEFLSLLLLDLLTDRCVSCSFIDGSGESFVFKLNKSDGAVSVYKWTGLNDLFMWSTEDRIAMGGGGDGFAFVLDNYFITGETCCSKTYNNPVLDSNADKSSSSFRISNLEIWGFRSSFG
jgi:LysM repeat protein